MKVLEPKTKYTCPRCHKHTLISKANNKLQCGNCGRRFVYDGKKIQRELV